MTSNPIDTNQRDIHLTRVIVAGLFNEFNYSINLRNHERVTVLIAPNGYGKTITLNLIDALFNERWALLSDIVFKEILYEFSNDQKITISKQPSDQSELFDQNYKIKITWSDISEKTQVWTPKFLRRALPDIERYLPTIARVSVNRWRDYRTDETYTFPALIETFRDHLPERIVQQFVQDIPLEIKNIVGSVHCKLIETQRLIVLPEKLGAPSRESERKLRAAVSEKADILKVIISDELNKFAGLSQKLDRSFPTRALGSEHPPLSPRQIAEELQKLEIDRQELMDAGILDAEQVDQISIPLQISSEMAKLLTIYVTDNRQKLQSLNQLLKKVSLFKELLGKRFYKKILITSVKNGFSIKFGGDDVDLEKLSSGEQHQLILIFDLLFETRRNSLVLIDEPEISLHIAWQKNFIDDLLKVIDLNNFDAVLATHSPQLIGKWTQLVEDLGIS